MTNTFVPKEGRIFLFPNKDPKHGKSPQITGKLQVNGELKQVSLWKEDKGKGVYYSGVVSDPRPEKVTVKDDSPDDLF
jgi:hypothetical protein